MALIEPPAGSFSRRESVLAGILAVVGVSNICAAIFFFASKSQQSNLSSLHTVFEAHLASAKFIDLTHPIAPGMPMWAAFDKKALAFGPAIAGSDGGMGESFVSKGDPFTYGLQGFIGSSYTLPTDQIGTQLDPPAHWNEFGATITDIPPTVSLCPLVVIDITAQVAAEPWYHAQVSDIEAWEVRFAPAVNSPTRHHLTHHLPPAGHRLPASRVHRPSVRPAPSPGGPRPHPCGLRGLLPLGLGRRAVARDQRGGVPGRGPRRAPLPPPRASDPVPRARAPRHGQVRVRVRVKVSPNPNPNPNPHPNPSPSPNPNPNPNPNPSPSPKQHAEPRGGGVADAPQLHAGLVRVRVRVRV